MEVKSTLSQAVELYHHGIYLGAEIGVADFSGEDKSNAKVGIHDILEFTDWWTKKVIRIDYRKNDCLPTKQTIDFANTLIKNPLLWKSYHLLINNCEHFATFCKTGKSISYQAIDFMRKCILNPLEIGSYFKLSDCETACAMGSVSTGSCLTPTCPSVGARSAGLSITGSIFVKHKQKSSKKQTE